MSSDQLQNVWLANVKRAYDEVYQRYHVTAESVPHQLPLRWRLVRMERAMQLIHDDKAIRGMCITCGDLVPEARLLLFPESVWCVACVGAYETERRGDGKYPWKLRPDVPAVVR